MTGRQPSLVPDRIRQVVQEIVLLAFGRPDMTGRNKINDISTDALDAEYEALCAEYAGALV